MVRSLFAALGSIGLGGSLLLASCLQNDPNHCANLQGDATCAEQGGGFCSICEAANQGCVAARPSEDRCYMPIDDPTTSETDPSTSTTTSSTTTGEQAECTTPGLDPACPESAPFCADQTCVPCSDPSAPCATADPARAICLQDPQTCVACREDADCEPQSGCDGSYACVGCTEHAQCPSGACNLFTGECFPDDDEIKIYIDKESAECLASGTGDGSASTPYCSIDDAMAHPLAREERIFFIEAASTPYGAPFNDGSGLLIAVLGSGGPQIRGGDFGLRATQDTRMLATGVIIEDGLLEGVLCRSRGRMWIDDSIIRLNEVGVRADSGCRRLVLRRVTVHANREKGIELDEVDNFQMYASAVVDNGFVGRDSRGITAVDATFEIIASTIAGNRSMATFQEGPSPTNLFCAGGPGGVIRNSIVGGNAGDTIICQWAEFRSSAIDTPVSMLPDDVLVLGEGDTPAFNENWFADLDTGNVTLKNPGATPLADVARWELGDPRYDIENVLRTPAPDTPEYPGADQP